MLRQIISFAFCFAFSFAFFSTYILYAQAMPAVQPVQPVQPVQQGNVIISPSISVRSTLNNEYPASINAEYIIKDWAGVGGYFGYAAGTNRVFIGARANIRPQYLLKTKILPTPPNFDYYVGINAGIMAGGGNSSIQLLPCVGLRYFVRPRIAPFIEVGSPQGYISTGVSFLIK